MKPNSRLPCSVVNRSTMNAQNTETTNRLKTEVQMKNARPTHTLAVAGGGPEQHQEDQQVAT